MNLKKLMCYTGAAAIVSLLFADTAMAQDGTATEALALEKFWLVLGHNNTHSHQQKKIIRPTTASMLE